MLIELLTPLMLATAPATITLPETLTYDHNIQAQVGEAGEVSYSTSTQYGTQTYDYNGKPRDADNDTDKS